MFDRSHEVGPRDFVDFSSPERKSMYFAIKNSEICADHVKELFCINEDGYLPLTCYPVLDEKAYAYKINHYEFC